MRLAPSTVSLDRILAVLVGTELVTGLLALGAGDASQSWVFVAHGLASGALLWAIALKLWRSVPRAVAARRWGHVALGLGVAFVALAALIGGVAWVASGRLLRVGAWTVLTLHAWAGLALVPLVVVHLQPRRWLLLRPGPDAIPAASGRVMTRRGFLAGIAFGGASLLLYGGASLLDSASGGERRFTGSRPLPDGGVPPSTTFLGEGVPAIDLRTWRLRVGGRVERELTYSIDDLIALRQASLPATLDCTSGWALTTTWSGIDVATVLRAAGAATDAGEITFRAVTGWTSRLTLDEANRSLLALTVAGRPLPPENGAPCRLVVPDRRGLDWVKWVSEIEIS